MCLIVFSIRKEKQESGLDPKYSYVLLANRDEYYERPTTQMDWWSEKNILAGNDNLAGGTWLGIARDGRFAAITNYKEDSSGKDFRYSRGELVIDYLKSINLTGREYLESLKGKNYAGFNLLVGDAFGIHSYSNRRNGIITLEEGTHALGNCFLNSETSKVTRVKKDFDELCASNMSVEKAFEMMVKESGDLKIINKDDLKNSDFEEIPFRFITSEFYGTRCTTFLSIPRDGKISVHEQTYLKKGIIGPRRDFKFLN